MMSFLLDIDQKDTKYRGLLYSIEYNSMNISYKLYISPFLCKKKKTEKETYTDICTAARAEHQQSAPMGKS